jgi:C1A family cysteine protease
MLPDGISWEDLDHAAAPYRARVYHLAAYDDIPEHLKAGRPILMPVTIYRSSGWFTAASKNGEIAAPQDDSTEGGHAITVVAYDQNDESIRFANSWGPDWGDQGFGSMTKDVALALLRGQEMCAVDVLPREIRQAESSADIDGPSPA